MKTIRIYTKNAEYQKLEALKTNRNKRYKRGAFFVEGVRNIKTALAAGWNVSSLIYSGEKELSDWARQTLDAADVNYILTAALMAQLSGKLQTSELLAVVEMRDDSPDTVALGKNPFIVLFDRPSNKGNLGTIIRSCDSFGADCLLLTGHSVDLYDPEVVTASMGSFFNLRTVRIEDNTALFRWFDSLRESFPGLQLVGSTAHRQTPLSEVDLTRPTVLMIGNETMGLNAAFKERCDVLATIPMAESSSATSLNVGCAATVMLYELSRQRALQRG